MYFKVADGLPSHFFIFKTILLHSQTYYLVKTEALSFSEIVITFTYTCWVRAVPCTCILFTLDLFERKQKSQDIEEVWQDFLKRNQAGLFVVLVLWVLDVGEKITSSYLKRVSTFQLYTMTLFPFYLIYLSTTWEFYLWILFCTRSHKLVSLSKVTGPRL